MHCENCGHKTELQIGTYVKVLTVEESEQLDKITNGHSGTVSAIVAGKNGSILDWDNLFSGDETRMGLDNRLAIVQIEGKHYPIWARHLRAVKL